MAAEADVDVQDGDVTTEQEADLDVDDGRHDDDDEQQDADRQGGQTGQRDKMVPQSEVDRIIADRLARERRKFSDYGTLKKKASELDRLRDGEKSEIEKLNEQLAEREVELQGFRVAEVRRNAALAVGLDLELAEFITAADEDEALEQAKKLFSRLHSGKTDESPARKIDLKQGHRKPPPVERSRDDMLRLMAGYPI